MADPMGQDSVDGAGGRAWTPLWILVAAIWTPWSVNWLMGSAVIEGSVIQGPLWGVSLGLCAWAARCSWGRGSRRTDRWQALFLSAFLFAPLLGEGLIRAGIAYDLWGMRNPNLYGDVFGDDDYWKLRRRWKYTSRRTLDARLGWTTKTTKRNPLGIFRAENYVPQKKDVVLCFGDSYMAGSPPVPHKIPDQMDLQLEGRSAYNYGVHGYGVGQTYLRFSETYQQFDQPIIVIGILERDLDRTILTVRGAAKPSFRLEGRELIMTPPIMAADPKDWDQENPPEIRSYLCALVRRATQILADKHLEAPIGYRQEEKCRVNRALIGRLVREARENKLRLLFVSFPSRFDLIRPSWRSKFLRDTFEELNVHHVNGRIALQQHMRRSGKRTNDYFLKDNHPNPMGNRVLAHAIASRIKLLWGRKEE